MVEETSKPKTVFTVPGMGLYQFKRMPYRVTNGPASFQTLIDSLIGADIELHAFSYFDDVIIIKMTFSDHLVWLERILKKMTEAGLTINEKEPLLLR